MIRSALKNIAVVAFAVLALATAVETIWPDNRTIRIGCGAFRGMSFVVLCVWAYQSRSARIQAVAIEPDPVIRIEELRARLSESREVGDPVQVLDLRDEIAPLLVDSDRRALDRETVAWLMLLLQKRLRAGTVRSDVADLAARTADRFGATPEGASLRASLPTLRRAAGLCPRCGKTYAGLEDACANCAQP
jgi:hypothetical protein